MEQTPFAFIQNTKVTIDASEPVAVFIYEENGDKCSFLFPVFYTNKRPLFPIDKLEIGMDGKVKDGQQLPAEAVPEIIKALTVKSNLWEYEREWRHIVFTKDAPNRLVKLPIISKIIMGINISAEDKEKVIEFARRKHIPVYATRLKVDKYEMIVIDQPE